MLPGQDDGQDGVSHTFHTHAEHDHIWAAKALADSRRSVFAHVAVCNSTVSSCRVNHMHVSASEESQHLNCSCNQMQYTCQLAAAFNSRLIKQKQTSQRKGPDIP